MNNSLTRIDDDLLEKIRVYSEIESKTQTDFLNDLLAGALENHMLMRSGGAIFTIPNPQNYCIDKAAAKDALEIMKAAAKGISKVNANLPFSLFTIIAYFEQRLFIDDSEAINGFKTNLMLDCTQSDNVTENTNV